MATSTRHNLCEIPINFIDQNLHQVRQISDTYVNERLNQASKVNQNWCTSYNKKFNVGWIINTNSIFFFQYLATKTNAKKTLVEFPKNQRISTPEHVKIFQRNKDLYAIVIYSTVIQIAKILSSKDEKELIEIINFPVEGEKIIALSDSWEESSALFLSVLTNKNSVYLIELEPRIAESKINLNISLQILHRKPISLLQKLKSYIAPLNDLEDPQVFCCMETSDRPGASVRTYNIFSYVEGRLEFWTITIKSHDDKYVLFSQTHKWAIDLRILLDHEFSQKLFEKFKKLADFEVLDFKPTLVRNQGQVVLIKLLARVNEINHQSCEGHFSFATVTLDDVNGAILKFDENVLHDGFIVPREELRDKDQVFYGRIVSILDNDDVHTCCHFSLRPKKGVYEESNNNGGLQNLTHTNLYTAIESNVVYSVAIEGKILGAGHYFSYEENAEDVLFITTENSLIRMKVLKYLTPTAFPGQLPSAQPSNTRDQPIISFDDLEEFSSRLVIALHTRNQIALKFKDMLNNAKDNLLGVKEELDELLKTRKLEEIKEGIVIYTNELLNDKTRNMVLLSTFTPSNQAKINQWSSESLDILTFELKKKVNVLYSWIEFLKKFHIWDIDSSIKEHAYSNLEKLIGAIKLCEEQTILERLESDSRIKEERKALLSQAVEACMNTWRLTPSLDVNIVNTNVFYTQIDKFEDFLIHLIQYHQDYVNETLSFDHMHFLADIIVTTFHELHKLRDMQEYENLFLWTQEENLLDHLFKIIQLFEKVLLNNAWNVSERQEDLARISYILIREYNNLYKRHPNEEKWKRELNRVYDTLFRHQLFERAGDFAEEFVHMDILARLYYECNYDHHIKDLFVKWADKKFLEEFVHNYIQDLKENKLENIPRRFILFTDFPEFYQEIMEILLREYPQVGWLLKLTEGNLSRADELIEQTSLKESVLRNRIASTSAGRFIHNQGTYEKVLRVDHLQEGNISQEKIVDPETLLENILQKENEKPVKVIEDSVKILSNIKGNEYYQNISGEQYKTMLENVIGKALEFDDDSIQKVDKLLNVPQGAQSNQIYNLIRETTIYRVIKDLLEIAKTEGTDLQTIVGNTNNNDPVTAKFIQKLISLN